MTKKIQLQFGASGCNEKLEIDRGSVTVFVGPPKTGSIPLPRESNPSKEADRSLRRAKPMAG